MPRWPKSSPARSPAAATPPPSPCSTALAWACRTSPLRRRSTAARSPRVPDAPCADLMRLFPATADANAKRLVLARGLRALADGYVSILLPAYLLALGLNSFEVGVLATATLMGSASLTLCVGLVTSRFGHRGPLLAAAGLMVATGCAFAGVQSFWPLLLVAFVGTINPSWGDVSVFLPLELALLAQTTSDAHRTALFARYSLDRLARRSLRRALRGGLPGSRAGLGCRRYRAHQAHVRALRAARRGRRPSSTAGLAGARTSQGEAPQLRLAPRADRLRACGAVQPRCLRRRAGRAVAAGAVALPAFGMSVTTAGRYLFLDQHAFGALDARRGAARRPHRPGATRWSSRTCRQASAWC